MKNLFKIRIQTKNWLFLVILMSLTFLSHGYVAWRASALFPDATQYVSLAQNLVESGHYTSNGGHFPDIIQPPLFPYLIALVYRFIRAAFMSGWLVTLLFRALTLIPLFYLTRRLFDARIARVAVILCGIHPLLFRHSILISSESTFGFLFLTALWLLFVFLEKWRLTQVFLVGLLSGLAYCVRIEGLLLVPIVWGLVTFTRAKTFFPKLKAIVIFTSVVVLVLGSTAYWTQIQTGQWQLFPKLRLILIHKKIWQAAQSEPGFNALSETQQYEQVIFKYAPAQRDLLATVLFQCQPKRERMLQQDLNHSTRSQSAPILWQRLLKFMSSLGLAYLNNLYLLGQNLHNTEFFPRLFWPLLILGWFREHPSHRGRVIHLQLGWCIFIFSLFLASHFELRFLWLIVHLTLIWCAVGLVYSADLIQTGIRKLMPGRDFKYTTTSLSLLLMLSILPAWFSIIKFYQELRTNQNQEAACIQQYIPHAATIIARSPVTAYLTGHRYAALPYVNFQQLQDYSQQFGVSSLWFTPAEAALRPELAADLANLQTQSLTNCAFKIISVKGGTIVNFNWKSNEE